MTPRRGARPALDLLPASRARPESGRASRDAAQRAHEPQRQPGDERCAAAEVLAILAVQAGGVALRVGGGRVGLVTAGAAAALRTASASSGPRS